MEVPEKLIAAMQSNRSAPPPVRVQSVAAAPTTLRVLKIRNYHVGKVAFGAKTDIAGDTLLIDQTLAEKAATIDPLVKKVAIDIIEPAKRRIPTNTIMDIMPICVKVEGGLGEGLTNYLQGAVVLLTGIDEKGRQVAEFGSSHGMLDEKIKFGMPGTPDAKDILVRVDVVIQEGTGMERRGPVAAHQVCDFIIEQIRPVLAALPERQAVSVDVFEDVVRPGKPRILIIKEVGGQGAMHEKLLLPAQPGGVRAARSVVDMGNVPVMLSPNEIKDGAIHSVT